MTRMLRPLALGFLLLAALFALPAQAATESGERILAFDVQVNIHPDASLTVTETITVNALGGQIKRGIYRDFPVLYRSRLGHEHKVDFAVLDVRRNGDPEGFHMDEMVKPNHKRVYIGQKDQLIPHGKHTYTFTYRTDRQLGFFHDFDELYWNVTGNEWMFPIDAVKATITLPPGARPIDTAGYTGRGGEKGRDYALDIDAVGRPVFTTVRPLDPGEGFTVAVSWPKGFVAEPDARTRSIYFFRDNAASLFALIGFLVVLGYYWYAWNRVGKDPDAGVVYPRFEPPRNMSPAALRFVKKMGFDDVCFASEILDMAVRGFLKIEERHKDFTLTRTGAPFEGLSAWGIKTAKKLFGGGDSVELSQENRIQIKAARDYLQKALALDFEKNYFLNNTGWLVPGILLTLLVVAGTAFNAHQPVLAGFIALWLSIWSVGVGTLLITAYKGWKTRQWGAALVMSLFAIPFVFGELMAIFFLAKTAGALAALMLLACIATNVFFHHWLKAPTLLGRRLLDEIEGFELFLSVTERERLDLMHPPTVTPEIFEKYLPYALALGVEHQWSERFNADLAQAGLDPATVHSPVWYAGAGFAAASFSNSFASSFSSAVSSAVPGSSSGSGGGGSSGGGGGGGGGGGW